MDTVMTPVACAVTGIILAGGKSRRLGRDKALERIGSESLIERSVRRLSGLSERIVVTNEQLAPRIDRILSGARVIQDVAVGQGPLGGIHAGLLAADMDYSLVVACDMPFLNRDLVAYMLSLRTGYDVVIPRVSGMLEPLHAVYSKNCLPHIESCLQDGRRVAYSFLDAVRVRFVDQDEVEQLNPGHLSFFNINDSIDIEKARALTENMSEGDPSEVTIFDWNQIQQ